MAISALHYR